jgi:ABC-type lipoprotein release transport system permease subunit
VVERTLSESGTDDDIRIYVHLDDAQAILGEKDNINEIKALQCLCVVDGQNVNDIQMLRDQLRSVLPDTKVLLVQDIASARESQRLMAEKYFSLLVPFVVVACMAWLGILSWTNVRDRRHEIGIMRALGYGSGKIASLFLGKAVVIGLIGAGLGFVLGTVLSMGFGPGIFKVTANLIKPQFKLLYWALIIASLFCALSAFIPSVWAVTQDPAVTLREE